MPYGSGALIDMRHGIEYFCVETSHYPLLVEKNTPGKSVAERRRAFLAAGLP